jgi:hypothetical protein
VSRRAARTRLRSCCASVSGWACIQRVSASSSAISSARQRSISCSCQRLLRGAQLGHGHGFAQRRLVDAAHQLAHVLHLPALAFVRLGAPVARRWPRAGVSGISACVELVLAGSSASCWPSFCRSCDCCLSCVLLGRRRLVVDVAVVGVDAAVRGSALGHAGNRLWGGVVS